MIRRACVLILVGFCSQVFAAGEPESAVVVVNANSWASTRIANEYVHARGIPASHVIYLTDLPSFERMRVEEFRQRILIPVQQTIDERGLTGQIDCVLYSADFPTAIDVSGDAGQRRLPQILTKVAAINGLTFLHRAVLAKDIRYLELGINRYARPVGSSSDDTPWDDDQRQQYAESLAKFQAFTMRQAAKRREASKRSKEKTGEPGTKRSPEAESPPDKQTWAEELAPILESLTPLRAKHPHSADLLYNLACVLAQMDRGDEAMEALRAAVQAGWWNYGLVSRDRDLRSLRQRADFQELIAQMEAAKFEVQPPVEFSATTGWPADGSIDTAEQGERFLLSTVLAYTSGRGNSVREALASLRRSIAADGTRPNGTVYFLENGNIRSTTREWGLRRAAEELEELGVRAAVEPGILPEGKSDVAGATIGTASFDWAASGSTILPGAICEHLTSCGGMLHEGAGQTPLTEFIRYGAAGASGTVTEPYAIQAKFPTPFIHWFYAQGVTLAEAFYLSVAGPYQLLIVGDGLCQPWVRQTELDVDGLKTGSTLNGIVTLTPRMAPTETFQPTEYELYLDGCRILTEKPNTGLVWDTTHASDGPHEVCVVGRAAGTVGTRAVTRLSVVVRNGEAEFELKSAVPAELRWDQPLVLDARMAGAKAIIFYQHSREVARITGSEGHVEVDARRLGQGPSRIQPVGVLTAGGMVWGQPIAVNVVPPPSLRAVELPAGKELASGFQVHVTDQSPQIIGRADGDWLAKAGVKNGVSFTVEAWFEVPDDDVYQFQLRGDARSLTVDGVSQDWPRGGSWWFVPVSLTRGLHHLHLEGIASTHPTLDVRFGGQGTHRLDGQRFRHAAD